MTSLPVLALFVGAYTLTTRYYSQKEATRQQQLAELASVNSPEIAEAVADQYDAPVVKARALLKGGDLSLSMATGVIDEQAFNVGESELPTSAKTPVEESLAKAQSMYERVLAMKNVHEIYHINAQMGLASVLETQADQKTQEANAASESGNSDIALAARKSADALWDEATAAFAKVEEMAGDDFQMIALNARLRREAIPKNRQPREFASIENVSPTFDGIGGSGDTDAGSGGIDLNPLIPDLGDDSVTPVVPDLGGSDDAGADDSSTSGDADPVGGSE